MIPVASTGLGEKHTRTVDASRRVASRRVCRGCDELVDDRMRALFEC